MSTSGGSSAHEAAVDGNHLLQVGPRIVGGDEGVERGAEAAEAFEEQHADEPGLVAEQLVHRRHRGLGPFRDPAGREPRDAVLGERRLGRPQHPVAQLGGSQLRAGHRATLGPRTAAPSDPQSRRRRNVAMFRNITTIWWDRGGRSRNRRTREIRMRALVYEGPGAVHFREVDDPVISSDLAALVRPTTVATCDLDRHSCGGSPASTGRSSSATRWSARWWRWRGRGRSPPRRPRGGVVPDQLRGLPHVPQGGHVGVPERREDPDLRTGRGGRGLGRCPRRPRGRALRRRHARAIPDGVSARQAASASDNVNDAYRCVAPGLAAEPGAPVLVVGNGAIALMAADCARRLGSEHVVLCSQQEVVLAAGRGPRHRGASGGAVARSDAEPPDHGRLHE